MDTPWDFMYEMHPVVVIALHPSSTTGTQVEILNISSHPPDRKPLDPRYVPISFTPPSEESKEVPLQLGRYNWWRGTRKMKLRHEKSWLNLDSRKLVPLSVLDPWLCPNRDQIYIEAGSMERLHAKLQERRKEICKEILTRVLASAKQRRRNNFCTVEPEPQSIESNGWTTVTYARNRRAIVSQVT